jgi:hypothetical protein
LPVIDISVRNIGPGFRSVDHGFIASPIPDAVRGAGGADIPVGLQQWQWRRHHTGFIDANANADAYTHTNPRADTSPNTNAYTGGQLRYERISCDGWRRFDERPGRL